MIFEYLDDFQDLVTRGQPFFKGDRDWTSHWNQLRSQGMRVVEKIDGKLRCGLSAIDLQRLVTKEQEFIL